MPGRRRTGYPCAASRNAAHGKAPARRCSLARVQQSDQQNSRGDSRAIRWRPMKGSLQKRMGFNRSDINRSVGHCGEIQRATQNVDRADGRLWNRVIRVARTDSELNRQLARWRTRFLATARARLARWTTAALRLRYIRHDNHARHDRSRRHLPAQTCKNGDYDPHGFILTPRIGWINLLPPDCVQESIYFF